MLGEKKNPLSVSPEFYEFAADRGGIRLNGAESFSFRIRYLKTVRTGVTEVWSGHNIWWVTPKALQNESEMQQVFGLIRRGASSGLTAMIQRAALNS